MPQFGAQVITCSQRTKRLEIEFLIARLEIGHVICDMQGEAAGRSRDVRVHYRMLRFLLPLVLDADPEYSYENFMRSASRSLLVFM